jgi:Endosomal/lysosomal potassium channel TMEM175
MSTPDDTAIINRLLAFSDGVFAVALTLLAVELRPDTLMQGATGRIDPQPLVQHFATYAGTFAVVAVFWLAHMSYMRRLRTFDWTTAVVNLLLLFWIVLTPFASATLGTHGVSPFAWFLYGGVMIGASVSQTLLWLVVSRDRGRLIGGVTWRERGFRATRALSPGLAFASGYLALAAGRTHLVVWSPLLIVPIMMLAGLAFGFRHPRP